MGSGAAMSLRQATENKGTASHDSGPGFFQRSQTRMLSSEFATKRKIGDTFVQELSNTAKTVVFPALIMSLRNFIGRSSAERGQNVARSSGQREQARSANIDISTSARTQPELSSTRTVAQKRNGSNRSLITLRHSTITRGYSARFCLIAFDHTLRSDKLLRIPTTHSSKLQNHLMPNFLLRLFLLLVSLACSNTLRHRTMTERSRAFQLYKEQSTSKRYPSLRSLRPLIPEDRDVIEASRLPGSDPDCLSQRSSRA